MDEHKEQYPIQTMCEVLSIPRSTYYHSLHKTESIRERENKELTKKIIQVHQESKERYGAPKIHQTLLKDGCLVSLKRVQRLMAKAEIRSITRKKYMPHTSREKVLERENLLERD
jgi:transposase InsO family protein